MSKSLIDRISEAADYVRAQAPDLSPDVGIIFGTGLSSLRTDVEDAITIPYGDIPHFVTSTVESHAGEMMLGTLEGRTVVAMRGRFHAYEGYTFQDITFPVRVMKALGINTLIVSNACGGLNPQWSKGDIMVIEDHINLMGGNPLVGCNDEALGPRFPDMCEPYTRELMELAIACATEEGLPVQKGVYVSVLGPNLETRAEYRMLRAIGVDAVGMSTAPEADEARLRGIPVVAFSTVTNECDPDALGETSGEAVVGAAALAEPFLRTVVDSLLREAFPTA